MEYAEEIFINGIANLANVNQCSSYINCNNNFNTVLLSGFIDGRTSDRYNITSSYSFVNYSGTIKNNSSIIEQKCETNVYKLRS